MIPILFSFLCLIVLLSLCVYLIYPLISLTVKDIKKKDVILFLIITIISIFLFIFFVSQNKTVLYWDYGGYYYLTGNCFEQFNNGFINYLKELLFSINNYEYNYILPTLLASVLHFSGGSFLAYTSLIFVLFYIPFCIIASLGIQTIICQINNTKKRITRSHLLIYYMSFLFFTVLLFPLMKGYIGTITLLPIISVFIFFWLNDFNKLSFKRMLVVSILLLFIVLSRRYYLFTGISIVIFVVLNEISKLIISKKISKETIINYLYILLICILLLSIFFNGYINMSINIDYAEKFSAYQNSITNKIWDSINHFGLLFLLLFLICIIYVMKNKKFTLISLLLSVIIPYLMLNNIQIVDNHHYNIFSAQLMFFLLIVLSQLSKEYNKSILIIFLLINSLNFANFYFPTKMQNLKLLSSLQYSPTIDINYDMYQSLFDYLEKNCKDKTVYVASSSSYFNSDILYHARHPKSPSFNIAYIDIDLRSGFNTSFFSSDYVIYCTPTQVHHENGQEVVKMISKILSTDNFISQNYEKINEIHLKTSNLNEEIKLYLLKKNKEYTVEQVLYFYDYFEKIYPDYPDLFKNRFYRYLGYM